MYRKLLTASRGGRAVFYPSRSSSGSRPLSPAQAVPRRSQTFNPYSSVDFVSVMPTEYLPVDRRFYDPVRAAERPAKRFSGRPAWVVAAPPPRRAKQAKRGLPVPLHSPRGLFFAKPQGVAVCVQRGTRREVLFSTGYAGRAGVNRRPGRQGPYSQVRCSL